METTTNFIFIFMIPVILITFYLLTKKILLITLLALFIISMVVLYIVRNSSRKEVLHVIQNNQKVYITLSDDELFSIELTQEQSLRDIMLRLVENEQLMISDLVYYINFVNFKNDALQRELNELIK